MNKFLNYHYINKNKLSNIIIMFTENGKGTIFDDVKPRQIVKGNIPENDIIKPTKLFSINNDKFDTTLIVDEYKMPSFKYLDDNSLNDFYDYPEIYMSQNPEYRYKYPKLTTEEYIKEQWQTEEGTPNELNRFLRQDQTNKSLEDIQKEDNAYQTGLQQIEKMISEDIKTHKESYADYRKNVGKMTPEEEEIKFNDFVKKEDNISKKEKLRNTYVKSNPVLIKPAVIDPKQTIEFQKKYKSAFAKKQTEKLSRGVEESKSEPQKAIITLKPPSQPQKGKDILENASPAIKARFHKMVNKVAEESKSNDPQKTIIKLGPNTPPPPKKASQLAQEYLEKVGKPRSNPSTPVTVTRKQLEFNDEDEYDSDSSTVNNDVYTPAHEHIPFFAKAYKILNHKDIFNLPDNKN